VLKLSSKVNECKTLEAGHRSEKRQNCQRSERSGQRPAGCVAKGGCRGRAVQVDSIKPELKSPRTKRLKPNCDVLLSTSAFKCDLHRYTEALVCHLIVSGVLKVGRCGFTPCSPRADRVWFQRLKLKCGKLLSNFAFNLRRYAATARSSSSTRLTVPTRMWRRGDWRRG